jgi:photosystem II stability/assembly factor-like uncharacterized protein
MRHDTWIRGKLVWFLFLTLLMTVARLTPARAAINWQINGPEGGMVNCFVSPDATGTVIFAGCNGGVYKSTDAGEHWQALPNSPPMVSRLAINPLNPNFLYAGWTNGVSKTSDGGRTWQLTLNSGYDASVYIPQYSGRPPTGLAVDPILPQNVYATFANTVGVHGAFCRSTDYGQTWTETTPPAYGDTTPGTLITINSLAIDPFIPSTLYVTAPATKSGIWRSQDSGQTFWFQGISGGIVNAEDTLYAEPDAQMVLYAYGSPTYRGTGVIRSNDWGDSWFSAHAPLAETRSVISHQGMGWAVLSAFGIGDPNFPGGGVAKGYYSPFTDPWISFSQGLGNGLVGLNTVLALQPHVPYGAFAGMASGVYRTDTMDNNGDWRPKNKGLSNAMVTCLMVAPDPQHTIYAGTLGGGIFKSTDRGASWQAINQGIALSEAQRISGTAIQINGLAVEWPNYFKIYAATSIGLFRSIDGGAHWLPTTLNYGADSVITDPQVPGTVYAIGGYDWETFTNNSPWRSTDAGQTWAPLTQYGGGDTLVNGPTSFPIYNIGGGGITRLNGLGQNWEDLFIGGCLSLAVDPRAPNTIYAGTRQSGVLKTIDGGEIWVQLSMNSPPFNFNPQRQVTAIAVDPANSDVYAGLQNGGYNPANPGIVPSGGIWKSSDGGATWTDLGLPSYRGVQAIALDPASSAIYCGLYNAGVATSRPKSSGTAPVLSLLLLMD